MTAYPAKISVLSKSQCTDGRLNLPVACVIVIFNKFYMEVGVFSIACDMYVTSEDDRMREKTGYGTLFLSER